MEKMEYGALDYAPKPVMSCSGEPDKVTRQILSRIRKDDEQLRRVASGELVDIENRDIGLQLKFLLQALESY